MKSNYISFLIKNGTVEWEGINKEAINECQVKTEFNENWLISFDDLELGPNETPLDLEALGFSEDDITIIWPEI